MASQIDFILFILLIFDVTRFNSCPHHYGKIKFITRWILCIWKLNMVDQLVEMQILIILTFKLENVK